MLGDVLTTSPPDSDSDEFSRLVVDIQDRLARVESILHTYRITTYPNK